MNIFGRLFFVLFFQLVNHKSAFMKFSDAYNNLTPGQQTILDDALSDWETSVHNEIPIVNNLRNESLLSQTDWDTKFKYLFSAVQLFGASYPHRWREIKKNSAPQFTTLCCSKEVFIIIRTL